MNKLSLIMVGILMIGFALALTTYSITFGSRFEHDTLSGDWNSLVKINDSTYINAYGGNGLDGHISTFNFNESNYSLDRTSTLEYDPTNGRFNALVKANDTTYINLYYGQGVDTVIGTFDFNPATYAITNKTHTIIDPIAPEGTDLIKMNDTTYIGSYSNVISDDGFIVALDFNQSDYNITNKTSLEFDTLQGKHSDLVKVNDTTIIVAYTGNDNDGMIVAFDFNQSNYNITNKSFLEHDPTNSEDPQIRKINDTTYIVGYAGAGSTCFITAFDFNPATYELTKMSTLEYYEFGCVQQDIAINSNGFTMVTTYGGSVAQGIASVLVFNVSTYEITNHTYDEFDTRGIHHSIVLMNTTTFINAYSGPDSDGYIIALNFSSSTSKDLAVCDAGTSAILIVLKILGSLAVLIFSFSIIYVKNKTQTIKFGDFITTFIVLSVGIALVSVIADSIFVACSV